MRISVSAKQPHRDAVTGPSYVSRRTKHLCFVMAMQAACLAAGLWMEHRYAVSSANQAAEQQAWSDLYQCTKRAHPQLSQLDVRDIQSGDSAGKGQELLDACRNTQGEWMIVDALWRPVFPPAAAHRRDATVTRYDVVEPAPSGGTSLADSLGLRRIKLALADGEHIALAYPLKNGHGHVLFHRALARIHATAATLLHSLPVTSIMTFVWTVALLGLGTYMILVRVHEDLDRERSRSATEALRQTKNLIRTRDAVIFGLAKLAESRDPDTGDHLERISVYCTTLAAALRRHPKFRTEVNAAFVRLIGISSALHDIGKVGVEDRILLKRGPLTPEERAVMQAHTVIGGGCLREIERRLGGSNFLQMARETAFAHHEHWDGTGYPKGLSGRAIPLAARIVAIADIYDALSTERVYKQALPHDECVAIIRSEAGRKLDPDLVAVWLTLEAKFRDIAQKYANHRSRRSWHTVPEDRPTDAPEREMEDLCAATSDAV